MTNVLLAGESWQLLTFEIKGQDVLTGASYDEAPDHLIAALKVAGASVTYQPCHVATREFPRTRADLEAYDLVILSDIGADTLQLTPQVRRGEADVDRCELLASYVEDGGALGMIGGYMSFAGVNGQARYDRTALADVLPVSIGPGDDRVEAPAGVRPTNEGVLGADLDDEWPAVLGYNRVVADADADVWATVGDDPLVAVGSYGDGRTFAFTTDCAPHWAPPTFLEWDGLPTLWEALLEDVTG
ncbi:glutamine amidotransferase [Natronosalvus rutilus]|uniref:Glutamine amidotransferase n=1 Tax=Natronosalvus rutilus TaxID=2953753 RepID=A0A9E7SU55_9EURY|nr:glutamine amidotransferase [Natronosalvus rutilus]UTF52482.1 glutamine amidotransferase [Natronosalvus rutilus]